jgi:hypothetical protein
LELALLILLDSAHPTTVVMEHESSGPHDGQSAINQSDDYLLALDAVFATNPQLSMATDFQLPI